MNYIKDFLLLEAKRTRQNVIFLSGFFASGVLVVLLSSSFLVSMKKDVVEHEADLQQEVENLEEQLAEKEATIEDLLSKIDQPPGRNEEPPREDQSDRISELEEKVEDQYKRIKQKEQEIEDLKGRLAACEARSSDDEDCQTQVDRIIREKEQVITRLERTVEDCEEKLAETDKQRQNDLRNCRQQQRENKGKIDELEKALRACQSRQPDCGAAIKEATAGKDSEIERLLAALRDCQSKQGTDRYRSLYQDCQKRRQELESQLNELQSEMKKIIPSYQQARQRLSCLEECLPSLRKRCTNCY